MRTKNPLVQDYLGRVRSLLPLRRGADIVRELESSIYDRVDDMAAHAQRPPDDEMVGRALAEIGEPEAVAGGFTQRNSIFDASELPQFRVYTAILFAVHIALVGVATTTGDALQFGPLAINPVGPNGFVSFAASALHAMLLDVGLMIFAFAAAGALRRRFAVAPKSMRVDVRPRTVVGRIVLAFIVAAALNFFRDRVFVVAVGNVAYPLFTQWFAGVLPLVTAVLVFAAVSDALYLWLGETRFTVCVDALHGVAGLACMLFLLRGDAILALPPIEQFGSSLAPLNAFLSDLGGFVVGFLALVFAVKTLRRLLRFAQL